MEITKTRMTDADMAALARAVAALERTSLAQRLNNIVGQQIAIAGKLLPAPAKAAVTKASGAALKAAMHVALNSLRKTTPRANSELYHRTLAAASGAAGGAFGLAALPLELPVSTTVMLRSIADIARNEGEDLSRPEAALSCLEVFALGGPTPNGAANADIMEGGYFAMRGVMAKSISEAATYLAQKTVVDEAAPVLVRLLGSIAGRFGVVVSQKLAAQAVPVIGAAAGAAINLAFTEHFQSLAHGHFTVRRLERAYGTDVVRAEYERLAKK